MCDVFTACSAAPVEQNRLISGTYLPGTPALRGHNCIYNAGRDIVIGVVDGPAESLGLRAHGLFQELREMIEYDFQKFGRPVAKISAEQRADRIASVVRSISKIKVWQPLLSRIGEIESFWENWEHFCYWGVLVAVSAFGLPQWEDRLPK